MKNLNKFIQKIHKIVIDESGDEPLYKGVNKLSEVLNNQKGYELIDCYGSFKITIDKQYFIPNCYGQEDSWCDDEYDVLLVSNNSIIIIIGNRDDYKYKEIEIPNNINFDLKYLGEKRAYYYYKVEGFIILRVPKDYYDTLPLENKFKEGESWHSGPHLKIDFNVKNIKSFASWMILNTKDVDTLEPCRRYKNKIYNLDELYNLYLSIN